MIEFYYHPGVACWVFRSPVSHAEILRLNSLLSEDAAATIGELRECSSFSPHMEWVGHTFGGSRIHQLELTPRNQQLFNKLCQIRYPVSV